MEGSLQPRFSPFPGPRADPDLRARRLERLIDRLPARRVRAVARWLFEPSARWARLVAGVLLILGGLVSILPVFGLWMLPLGLLLLAEDVPPLRRATDRALDWAARRWPGTIDPTPSPQPDARKDIR